MEIDFLKDIEIKDNDKEIITKSIRFNSEEFYMLQFCKYKKKRFGTLVKELLIDAIKKEVDIINKKNKKHNADNNINANSNIDENKLTELIRNMIQSELQGISITKEDTIKIIEETKEEFTEDEQDGRDALSDLGMDLDR